MKIITFHLPLLFIFFIFQGCASNSPNITQQNNAKLVDLGNGTCRQSNGLIWQTERSGKFSSFEEAEKYVKNLDLAGYSDWRFPTKDELFSLCNLFKNMHNCRDQNRDHDGDNEPDVCLYRCDLSNESLPAVSVNRLFHPVYFFPMPFTANARVRKFLIASTHSFSSLLYIRPRRRRRIP